MLHINWLRQKENISISLSLETILISINQFSKIFKVQEKKNSCRLIDIFSSDFNQSYVNILITHEYDKSYRKYTRYIKLCCNKRVQKFFFIIFSNREIFNL